MRALLASTLFSLSLSLAIWPESGQAQRARDFVFTDEDGHLVIRFPGTQATGLSEAQRYEVLNAEFSSMVHDHLHADLQFGDEPRDPDWARWMEPKITRHVGRAGPEFSDIVTECRAASCRIVMDQPGDWSDVTAHLAVLETMQHALEAFIATHAGEFEPVFMIAAYDQHNEIPHIKAFLRRTQRD